MKNNYFSCDLTGHLDAQVLVDFKSLKKYDGDSMRGNERKKTEGKD
jgi:hypothetical protein